MAKEKSFIFQWRQAITRSGLNPTTRHVLLTLSLHMDKNGGSCWPSTRLLSTETGLTERTICTHLQAGRETGFIFSQLRGANGQDWASHEYQALVPTKPAAQQEKPSQGTEPRSAPPETKGTEPLSVPQPEQEPKALNVTQEGTEPDDIKALKDVQSSKPMSMPLRTPIAPNGAQVANEPKSSTPPDELLELPGEAETQAALDEFNRKVSRERAETLAKTEKQKTPRPPDLVWEAMLTGCGISLKAKFNDIERKRFNKARKLLREVDATADEVLARCKAYRRKYAGVAITPMALASNWSVLVADNVGTAIKKMAGDPT